MTTKLAFFSLVLGLPLFQALQADSFEQDRRAILGMSGCFMVDYNYHEVQALVDGYQLDPREYHASVNSDFKKFAQMYSMLEPEITPENYQLNVKEKIWVRENSDNTINLQHVIFLTNKDGQLDFVMKHHSERWRYEADRTFSYEGNSYWLPRDVQNNKGQWTRDLNALDDSPRYSCTAAWDHSREFPTWTCSGYSPIPGRESRDMGRKDYQGLNRTHILSVYPNAWLDTQNNEKVREQEGGDREAFVAERGRNWYTRLPDEDCGIVDYFIEDRSGFWDITESVWDDLMLGDQGVFEGHIGAPRWLPINGGPFIIHPGRKMHQYSEGIEQEFVASADQGSETLRNDLASKIRGVIDSYNQPK